MAITVDHDGWTDLFDLVKQVTKYYGKNESDISCSQASSSYVNRLIRGGQVRVNGEVKTCPEAWIDFNGNKPSIKVGGSTLY